jgi:transcriptional regulator with XRE-family HTH domain
MDMRPSPPLSERARDLPLADLIVLLRTARGLSQRELASAAGVSERALRDLERGITRRPQRGTMRTLAAALDADEATRSLLDRAARPSYGGPLRASPRAHPDVLVGRDNDLAALAHLLSTPGVRLVTITGPAGVGKSRLADELALATAGTFRLVEMSPNGKPYRPTTPDRHLLVLDDVAPTVDTAARVGRWLAAAPSLCVVATARDPLRLRGEHRWRLGPLAIPDPEIWDPVALSANPSVSLLVRRGAAARPGFAVTNRNAGSVASLARRSAGVPLALELIAARLRVRQPEELDADLARHASDPSGVARLADVIRWSLLQLSAADRRVLRELTVTPGTEPVDPVVFTLAAAGLLAVRETRVGMRVRVPEPVRAVLSVLPGVTRPVPPVGRLPATAALVR